MTENRTRSDKVSRITIVVHWECVCSLLRSVGPEVTSLALHLTKPYFTCVG